MTRKPFYAYSSYNRADGRTHPLVLRRRNRVLAMWAQLASVEAIADALDIHVDTVRHYIRRARRAKDTVIASRPVGLDALRMRARLRRANIGEMATAGIDPKEIASRLGVSLNLVYRRLKERRS